MIRSIGHHFARRVAQWTRWSALPKLSSRTISLTISQSQKVLIQIFDVTGRLIETLADVQMEAGTHQLVWNARDEEGNKVIAEIYFLKMQTGNYSETRKLVVVK